MTEQVILHTTIVPTVDCANAHRFCTTTGYAGAGEKAVGILNDPTLAGQSVAAKVLGIALVETGGAIPVESAVTSDASGRAVVAAGADAINGYSLDESTGTGEKIRIILK